MALTYGWEDDPRVRVPSTSTRPPAGTPVSTAYQVPRPAGVSAAPPAPATSPTPAAPATPTAPDPTTAITNAYQQYLGRAPDPSGLQGYLQNPRGVTDSVNAIRTSREANAYGTVSSYQDKLAALAKETDPTRAAAVRDALSRDVYQTLQAAGHEVKWEGADRLVVDGRAYTIAGGQTASGGATGTSAVPAGGVTAAWFTQQFGRPGTPDQLVALEPKLKQYGIQVLRNANGVAGKIRLPDGTIVDVIRAANLGGGPNNFQWLTGGGGGGGGTPNGAGGAGGVSWQPQGAAYTPDLSGLDQYSLQNILGLLQGEDAGSGVNAQTGQLISSLLQNPDIFSGHDIEAAKALSKEELAALGSQADETLLGQSYASGIGDSPWLASERAAGRRDRDESLVRSYRDIEMDAAAANRGAKERVATLGGAYADSQRSQQRADVTTALDTGLRSILAREGLRQAGSGSQLNYDALLQSWAKSLLADQQFGAQYGLDLSRLQLDAENQDWSRYLLAILGGG